MSLVSLVTFQTVSQKRKLLVGLTLNVIGNGNGDVDVDGVGNGYGYGGMVWVWVWLWVWGDEDEDDDDDDDSTLHFTPGSLHSPSLFLLHAHIPVPFFRCTVLKASIQPNSNNNNT